MKFKTLLIGTFSGGECGEKACNRAILEYLRASASPLTPVKAISTNISSGAETPGRFGVFKFFLSLLAVTRCIGFIPFYQVVYITPGLSFLGVCRAAPLIFWAKLFKKPIICHYHGSRLPETYEGANFVSKYFISKTFSLVTGHIFLTKSLANLHKGIHRIESFVIVDNFVDDAFLKLSSRKKYKKDREFKVLFLSNLIPEKGWEVSVVAVAELIKEGHSISLSIAGMGSAEEVKNLVEIIKSSGCSDHIKYLGPVFGQNKVSLFQENDCFLLPTSYVQEGLPIVILEALAAGCYVIASRKGGIPDIIKNGENGLLLTDTSREEVKKAVKMIVANEVLRRDIDTLRGKSEFRFTKQRFLDEVVSFILKTGGNRS